MFEKMSITQINQSRLLANTEKNPWLSDTLMFLSSLRSTINVLNLITSKFFFFKADLIIYSFK
jgi:hypothetical protein